jgi:hypothetical protein
LNTGRVITRRRVTIIPMTVNLIKQVEKLAASEGMKGLKKMTNSGKILYDSSWIAGVNYRKEEDEAPDEYEYEESDDIESDTIDPEELAEELGEDTIQANQSTTIYNRGNEDIENDMIMDNDEEENDEINDGDRDESKAGEELVQPRKSTRIPKPTIRYTAYKHQGYSQIARTSVIDEYNETEAKVLATIMCQFKERMKTTKIKHGNQYVVTYSLKKE